MCSTEAEAEAWAAEWFKSYEPRAHRRHLYHGPAHPPPLLDDVRSDEAGIGAAVAAKPAALRAHHATNNALVRHLPHHLQQQLHVLRHQRDLPPLRHHLWVVGLRLDEQRVEDGAPRLGHDLAAQVGEQRLVEAPLRLLARRDEQLYGAHAFTCGGGHVY